MLESINKCQSSLRWLNDASYDCLSPYSFFLLDTSWLWSSIKYVAHPGRNNSLLQSSCTQRPTFQTLLVQNSWLIFSLPYLTRRSDTCNLLQHMEQSLLWMGSDSWAAWTTHTHKATAVVHIEELLVGVCIDYCEFDGTEAVYPHTPFLFLPVTAGGEKTVPLTNINTATHPWYRPSHNHLSML